MKLDPELVRGMANEEFADISLYKKEAELFSRKIVGGRRIAETFALFAGEESAHVEALKELAGEDIQPADRIIEPGNSLRGALRMHIRRETESIRICQTMLKFPLSPVRSLIVKGMILDEQNHLDTITRYLRILEKNPK